MRACLRSRQTAPRYPGICGRRIVTGYNAIDSIWNTLTTGADRELLEYILLDPNLEASAVRRNIPSTQALKHSDQFVDIVWFMQEHDAGPIDPGFQFRL